jgi:thiamine kinase-like enzyme
VLSLLAEPWPLIDGLARTPWTFIHGDWKLGNLGSYPDGRTILVDWDRSCAGPPCFELAWYLAVNCDRMTLSKSAAIDAYRGSLERRGIDTGSWWQAQLALALLGGLLMLGWAKTEGNADEIGWWEERALDAVRYLP